jgi:hypothetical protein
MRRIGDATAIGEIHDHEDAAPRDTGGTHGVPQLARIKARQMGGVNGTPDWIHVLVETPRPPRLVTRTLITGGSQSGGEALEYRVSSGYASARTRASSMREPLQKERAGTMKLM